MFDPKEYIQPTERGFLLCKNPVDDGGLASITVNPKVNDEGRTRFQETIQKMVLNKLVSPKFAEVLLTANKDSFSFSEA